MSDWDDSVETNANDFQDGDSDVNQGRSFGKGRGFVPQRNADAGWSNDRSEFSGRGRGRGGGRGGRGRGFKSDGDRDGSDFASSNNDDSWGNSNSSSGFGRSSDGENRRGRGGGRGRGGRSGFDDNDDDKNGKDFEDGEEPEKKPEPVTYVPQERTEEDLFNDTGIQKGINFDDYESIDVNVTGENKPPPINSFRDAQFRELIMTNLKKCKYDKPTPIQKYAIPVIMAGRDLMATAQTGSGKTAAFLLPIIHRLLADNVDASSDGRTCSPQALILSPTRELAIQIRDNARLYTASSTLKVQILYGGVSTRHQGTSISAGCNILIATPGRLVDFVNRGWVKFNDMKFVVLDEADRMLDMGFSDSIQKVVNHDTMSPQDDRQTLMFSATFSQDIQKMAAKYLRRDYIFVAVGIVGGACKDVEQNFIEVNRNEKRTKLLSLLDEQDNVDGTLLFVEQKRIADFLATFLSDKGYKTTSIHGDRQQFQREEALRDFRSKRMSLLVATNVAARGLDISGVKHVINYDLPKEIDEYVHRIGRTGRLGNKGKATSFYDSDNDRDLANNLVRILKQAKQQVPTFIEQDATGAGDYESGGFGAVDYRNDAGFKTDPFNQPQPVGVEDWN